MQEDYIFQVSEEIEGRVTKKLSQEFSRTESRILGALSRLDDFFWTQNPGFTPDPFRRHPRIQTKNQGTNEDPSQNDPHPGEGVALSQSS